MRQKLLGVFSVLLIISLISATACVAPPKPSGTQTQGATGGAKSAGSQGTATEEPTTLYVTFVTPYGATPQKTAVPAPTTSPPEEWVEIFNSTRPFGYNKTAITFDLKNPPMMVNFSLIPVNVTGTKVVVKQKGSDITTTSVRYDYYSPYSWFEVTVRNADTGQILQQDGFGNSYGRQYSTEVNQTLKVIKQGNIHLEMDGNQITAIVSIRVKKEGNINLTGNP